MSRQASDLPRKASSAGLTFGCYLPQVWSSHHCIRRDLPTRSAWTGQARGIGQRARVKSKACAEAFPAIMIEKAGPLPSAWPAAGAVSSSARSAQSMEESRFQSLQSISGNSPGRRAPAWAHAWMCSWTTLSYYPSADAIVLQRNSWDAIFGWGATFLGGRVLMVEESA